MNQHYLTIAIALAPIATTLAGGSGALETPLPPETGDSEVTEADEITFKAYWKNGLQFVSSDKATKIQLGGRIYNDWAWFSADTALDDAVGPHENGTEMRSARIYIKGTIDKRYFFKANYDFGSTKVGDGGPGFKDVYMGIKEVPVLQNLQIGHYKEPIGLDVLTSSKYTTFMERSLTGGSEPARNTGLMAFGANSNQRVTFAAGVFRDSNKFGEGSGDGSYAFTGRVTGLPMTNDDHTNMIHLGLAASHRESGGANYRLSPRPESHLAPRYLDTGDIVTDSRDLIGLEWASVTGPFYTQAEYVYVDVNGDGAAASPTFRSYYGQASWFLTGESKPYVSKSGTFGRLKPKNSFGDDGWGAWELALRYATTDLNSGSVTGGELTDITLGLNWYLSSFSRLMANYINADVKGLGESDIFMLRFQIDF